MGCRVLKLIDAEVYASLNSVSVRRFGIYNTGPPNVEFDCNCQVECSQLRLDAHAPNDQASMIA